MGNPIRFIDPTGDIPSPYESDLMSSAVYRDKNYSDRIDKLEKLEWKVSSVTMPFSYPGLDAMIFERQVGDTKEYACVFAGTADWHDYIADASQLWGGSKQYAAAIKNARMLHAQLNGFELTFVGHSLAGGEAAAASKATGRAAITFNPAALTNRTISKNSLTMRGDIANYISSKKDKNGEVKIADPLTFIQNLVGLKASGTNFPVFVDDYVSHGIDDIVDAFSLEHTRK